MSNGLTSINVKQEVKKEFLELQRKHRYKNASFFIADMVSFFESNGISPRQKTNLQAQIRLFKESLFKRLGVLEAEYLKPHYSNLNMVSEYLKAQFGDAERTDVQSHQEKRDIIHKKEDSETVDHLIPIFNKKLESIEYLLGNFEKMCIKRDGELTIGEERYTKLKMSIMNVLRANNVN